MNNQYYETNEGGEPVLCVFDEDGNRMVPPQVTHRTLKRAMKYRNELDISFIASINMAFTYELRHGRKGFRKRTP